MFEKTVGIEDNICTELHRGGGGLDIRKKILLRQIGAKIAYYRTLRDLKQEELSSLAHISQSVLSRIESGKYNDTLSVSMLMNIADGLQIDMALLVTFNDVEKSMWWQPLSRNTIENDEVK